MTSAVSFFLGNGGGAAVAGAGALAFQNDLTLGDLQATGGRGPTLSPTRATASTTTDFEGLVKPILSGEARFWKLRRVENLAGPPDFTNATWTKTNCTVTAGATDPNGGTTAYTMTATAGSAVLDHNFSGNNSSKINSVYVRRRTGTGTITISSPNNNNINITAVLTTSWQRFTTTALQTGGQHGIKITSSGDEIDVWHPQQEAVDGQAITAPSEYVSKDVLSTPYHGAGVDGVKYFSTANGNTVASNVVTEATGASLTLTAAGISVFGASTERLLQNRDLTNAAWTKGATATVAKDQTGVDGVANSASSFTGGAVTATNTVTQNFTLASSARYQYAYIKRLVGSGTIEMTTDGGTSWVNITSQISASWALVTIPVQTVTNPTGGLRITTNADKIAVDFMSNRSEWNIPPVVQTAGSQVAVNADVPNAALAGILSGSIFVKAIGHAAAPVAQAYAMSLSDGTNNETVELSRDTSSNPKADVIDGGVSQASIDAGTWTSGAVSKFGLAFATNDFAAAIDGGAEVTDASGTLPTVTTVKIGVRGDGTGPWNGVIQEARVYSSDQNMTALTQ